jgi:hypothetical protein
MIEMSRGGSTNSSPGVSGRNFLKLMAAAGVVMTFAPFVDVKGYNECTHYYYRCRYLDGAEHIL